MFFLQSYYTDIGTKRKNNQDSLAIIKAKTEHEQILMAMVCDGMGGYKSGELASKTCLEAFVSWFKNVLPYRINDDGVISDQLFEDWRSLIIDTNEKLCDYGSSHNISLGTTLTVFLFYNNQYYTAHVGDSRGYLLDGSVHKITRDQSVVGREVEEGRLTEEEAKIDKRRNVLLESIGITRTVNPEFYEGTVKPNTTYLICTDGFWKCIEKNELLRYFNAKQIKDNKTLRVHLNYMVEQVKLRGETDNISAVGVIPVSEER